MNTVVIDGEKALEWLIEGNNDYIHAKHNHGDISKEKRIHTHRHGQNPFAIIISCSDSRVIPEGIFMKGIGDLFVIRAAGNVLDDYGLGSIEYGLEHLGCKLILVLGHTKCGAIEASLGETPSSYIGSLVSNIKNSIGTVKNPLVASKMNVFGEIRKINENILNKNSEFKDVLVKGAIYHTSTGKVQIL